MVNITFNFFFNFWQIRRDIKPYPPEITHPHPPRSPGNLSSLQALGFNNSEFIEATSKIANNRRAQKIYNY